MPWTLFTRSTDSKSRGNNVGRLQAGPEARRTTHTHTTSHTRTTTHTSTHVRGHTLGHSAQELNTATRAARSMKHLWSAYCLDMHRPNTPEEDAQDQHLPAQGHAFYIQVAKWSTAVHNTGGWAGTDLSHGMKSLNTKVLGAQCTIGGTPLANCTPRYTAITPMCHVFGALPLLNQAPTPDFSFRKVFVHTQLTTIEPKHIPLFLSDATKAVVVLHNRDFHISVRGREDTTNWSNMLQIHADQGTGHMLAHWNQLRCNWYSTAGLGNEKWAHRPVVWDLWLLQGGLADVAWQLNHAAYKQRYTTSHAEPPHILAMTYLHVMQGPQPAKHTNTQHGGGDSGMQG